MARQPQIQPAPPQPEPVPTTGGPALAEAGGIVTIDLGAIHANYRTLASRVVPGECAAVVKGDAYGCGVDQVTATLTRAGCRTFFVAHLAEARQVRTQAPEAVIYVLNGFSAAAGPGFMQTYARPVINSSVELAEWDLFVSSTGWDGGAALHVDTGMNRLGITVEEAAAVAPRIQTENHGITLLMSHLACADQPEHPLNDRQIRQFREIRWLFRGIAASLANSAGIFLDASTYCDLVRPGIALYGGNPIPSWTSPIRPVVEVKARILQVRNVPKGGTIGYGAAWTAKRASRIARGDRRGLRRRRAAPRRHHRNVRRARWRLAARGDRWGPALPHDRPHLHGSHGGRRHRPAGERGAPRRHGQPDRRRLEPRRGTPRPAPSRMKR
jgi:alanine racemase